MEPISLAVLTTAAWAVLNEAAGEAAWDGIKALFGWKKKPAAESLAKEIAEALAARPELEKPLRELIEGSGVKSAGGMVGSISAKNVVVAKNIHGDLTFR